MATLSRLLGRTALVVVLAGSAVAGLVPTAVPVLGAAPAAARGSGQQPFDDILAAADQYKRCGLSRDQLAAMMMAPTYPETGASGEQAPSPMTLSRWDTQSSLYAFGDKNTPYQKAFWHPGVGMWQFDSAGGWNLTAATAISTPTAAAQAALTIANRWCVSPTLSYAWGPWYGCATNTANCQDIYNFIFDGTALRNITMYPNVTRDGGMESRSCWWKGAAAACSFIDPARAQGFAGWANPAAGPTPVTAPFYDLEVSGREIRVWLKDDTGYDVTISADKAVTANARGNLTWSTAGGLCDLSTNRGDCSGSPRVATTPWGPRVEVPFGSLDVVSPGDASITAAGWAIDPDTNDPIDVHLYVDGVWFQAVRADLSRPDVDAAIPGYGAAHGYQTTLSGLSGGPHQVCAYGINVGPYGDQNPLLGCRTVSVAGNPFGNLEGFSMAPGGVFAEGWALDPDTTGPIAVHIYVDGAWGGWGSTTGSRPDVLAAWPWFGSSRGFQIPVALSPGSHQVCAYAINVGAGTTNTSLGCRSVVTPDGTPLGNLEAAARTVPGLHLAGWTLDPSTASSIYVHVYVNGVWSGAYQAGSSRPDVAAAFPGFGNLHGFDLTLPWVAPGSSVCIYAINSGPGATNPLLGCRVV